MSNCGSFSEEMFQKLRHFYLRRKWNEKKKIRVNGTQQNVTVEDKTTVKKI